MDIRAAHALIRFGLGRRGDEALPADPRGWLKAQLAVADPGPPGPALAEAAAALKLDRQSPPAPGTLGHARQIYRAEMEALCDQALTTATPFRERLVWFWANHFTVSLRGGATAAFAGDFMRNVIRPRATGRFVDLLLAVMRHPAMLLYLDNAGSRGPNSPAGLRTGAGLNENLARECLELHTVTPASGYTQADVTSFAKILTGWSIESLQDGAAFRFRPYLHEPGELQLMGRPAPGGEAGGVATLQWLGTHPATYRHLAAKLACHFIADEPPPAAVHRIEAVLRDTGGDLGRAAAAVVDIDAAWTPLAKLRSPQDFTLAALRAADLPPEHRPNVAGVVARLGQPLFAAPFPIGWPDRAADWAGPEAMMRRIDWSYNFAQRLAGFDPDQLAVGALGPLLSADTDQQIRRAGSRRDALTLLFTSPEFQRR